MVTITYRPWNELVIHEIIENSPEELYSFVIRQTMAMGGAGNILRVYSRRKAITPRIKQRAIKTAAIITVVLVQKVLPLVPSKLCPVPENNPHAVLGCWIKITPISR